jgi:hypothetical protein
MLSMREIVRLEDLVADALAQVRGPSPERDALLEARGVYDLTAQVIAGYAFHTALEGRTGLESVKRYVFYAWAGHSLPRELTGIRRPSNVIVAEALMTAQALLLHRAGDDELRDMLAWYHGQDARCFTSVPGLERLAAFCAARAPDGWRMRGWDEEQFHGRGGLGRYWTRLLRRLA